MSTSFRSLILSFSLFSFFVPLSLFFSVSFSVSYVLLSFPYVFIFCLSLHVMFKIAHVVSLNVYRGSSLAASCIK